MQYLQVAVTAERRDAETISDWLNNQGALSVTVESANEQEIYDSATPGDPTWEVQRLTALFGSDLPGDSLGAGLSRFSLIEKPQISRLEDQDWERKWLDQFVPIETGRNLWVCPSWLTPPDPQSVNLIIDPGLAFGTGTHPTTSQILDYLSRHPLKNKNIVDYGCGSGILAIAALALGARRAIGVDVDPKAVKAAVENARKNSVEDRFTGVSPEQFDENYAGYKADVVIANILASTLLDLRKKLTSLAASNATILLSGVLEHQGNEIKDSYAAEFEFDQTQQQHWLLLVGTKRSKKE